MLKREKIGLVIVIFTVLAGFTFLGYALVKAPIQYVDIHNTTEKAGN